ncbi:MAG: DUF3810 domain-containing protein [Clostridia bacterium]|nr:DUF3810 domain-containing protein [Clostridia bacterium]
MKLIKRNTRDEETVERCQEKTERFGWGWRIIYILFGLSAIAYAVAVLNQDVADFICEKVGAVVRYALAIPTNILPFSLGEVFLIALIPLLVVTVIVAYRNHCSTWKSVWIFAGKIMSVALVILILFVWTLGTGYHGTTLDRRLGLDKKDVSEDDLYELTVLLTEQVNQLASAVKYADDEFSQMPYSLGEMNDLLLDAYDELCATYDFLPRMYSRVKPVMLSELMSYTHITGVYSFFTGEANLNVAFPDYTLPYTAAHELAHQRGIAREDEANFIAFLACTASDDLYIQYSGYLNMLEYVTNAYARAVNANRCYDFATFKSLVDKYDEIVSLRAAYEAENGEIKSYTDFLSALENDAALKNAVEENAELSETLGFYRHRAASVERYNGVRLSLDAEVRAEQKAYDEFFEKYRHNIAATISGAVNDTYLQMQGTAGTASYGMVVDLAVSYFKKG